MTAVNYECEEGVQFVIAVSESQLVAAATRAVYP